MNDTLKNTTNNSLDAIPVGSGANVPDGTGNDATTTKSDTALADIGSAVKKSDTMQHAITSAASDTVDLTTQMAERIIKEQEGIIGPVAYEQATKVQGIFIDLTSHHITLRGDKKMILENLVKQYEQLFGRISIAICKEAVRGVIANIPNDQIPQILL